MKRMKLLLPLLALALALTSCERKPDTEGFKKTVDEYNAISSQSLTTADASVVAKYYAENAVEMPPNMAPIRGKEAIEKWMSQVQQSGMKVTSCKFTMSDFGVGGTIGYQYGLYEMTVEGPGMSPMSDRGTYVSIWSQQKDGSWKIIAETWNSSNPPAAMEMK
jgi:ketosteroid isomerase-like protein